MDSGTKECIGVDTRKAATHPQRSVIGTLTGVGGTGVGGLNTRNTDLIRLII